MDRNGNKIIAVDFDGTLFSDEYPKIGKPNKKLIAKLRREQFAGARTILNTLREDWLLEDALKACDENQIHLDAVNDNLPDEVERWGHNPRKIAADEYWDDRNVMVVNNGAVLNRRCKKCGSILRSLRLFKRCPLCGTRDFI